MPNLFGVVDPGAGADAISQVLGAQERAVSLAGFSHQSARVAHAGAGMGLLSGGHIDTGGQPAATADGRRSLLLDGEVLNAGELARSLKLPGAERMSMTEACLAVIQSQGVDIVARFNGSFVLALLEHRDNRISLISDRLGIRPVFIGRDGQRVVFATELKGLLAGRRTPAAIDPQGTLELLSFGTHVFGRTWIDGVTRLAPATCLTVDDNGVRERSYWTYRYDESAPHLDQQSYSSVYARLVDRAVGRRLAGPGRVGVFLSGGYDSRIIAAAVPPDALPLPACTFGADHSRDVRYAAELADALGFDHHVLLPKRPYLMEHCRDIVWRTEGMLPFCNVTSIQYHDAIQASMDIIVAGFLGEFSGSHTWPALLMARSRADVVDAQFAHLTASRAPAVRRVFNDRFLDSALAPMRARFAASYEAIDNDRPMNVADTWNFRYLHPQETYQAPAIDRHRFEVRMPLTDRDLVDFALTIPPLARLEHRVYKKAIAFGFPAVRHVPCTNSGKPIDPRFAWEYAKMTAAWAGRKALAPLARLRRTRDLGREFRDLAQDFRDEPALVTDVLEPLLADGVFSDEWFDPGGIRALASDHNEGRADHHMVLAGLISWGLARRMLLDGDSSGVSAGLKPANHDPVA